MKNSRSVRMLKRAAAKALCSRPTAAMLRLNARRHVVLDDLVIDVDDPNIFAETRAALFWGFYERAERRLIAKHFDQVSPTSIVELGSSIGVTGAHMLHRSAGPVRYVGVEANVSLFPILARNLRRYALGSQVDIVEGAIDYTGEPVVHLNRGSNSAGSSIDVKGVPVPAVTLSNVLGEHKVLDGFALIADIEGAEVPLALQDAAALRRCALLIIETHAARWEGRSYTPKEVLGVLEGAGMEVIDQDGDNYAMRPVRRG